MKKTMFLALSALLITSFTWAQKASPATEASGKVNGATINIKYSAPSVKSRTIWGALVPYDKVWRAGANEATIFETDKDIQVEGKTLRAGKYSLYAIPGQKEWTIIFNSATGQWGVTRGGETTEDPAKDVLRVKAKPVKVATLQEKLSYDIMPKGFALRWENLEVPVSIK